MPARRSAHALAAFLAAVALTLAGCSGGNDSGSAAQDKSAAKAGTTKEDADTAPGASGSGPSGAKASTPPKAAVTHVIRTASVSVQVKDVAKALDAARTAAVNAGGYVGDETTTRDEEDAEHTEVVLRVPVERYDAVLADLQGAGKLLDRTSKAQDVTDQVVDVASRVQSQRASVARVRELMDRATSLSDVVSLEGELSRRQADLESLLAQQASLKDRTSLATITLTLSQTPAKEPAKADDDPGVVDALSGGWDAFVTALRWIVVVLAAMLPFLLAAAFLVVVWWRVVRPRRTPRPAVAAPAFVSAFPQAGPGAAPTPEQPEASGDGKDGEEGERP
ncbi:DUF4349 domain-containing protein [Streptomyces acidiscabies]|uniref:DUF4349 domain-containing protein n=1 Tax=Streptomyces acidiscabies TaxID=42234 RepID=A0AAP6EFG2_9ACTN|nr:DUF4349 domain-containing protein [Streptomyces acidiscabies]MBP5936229.1 DUF4349 domain-containing protein [Streptomyces sp. LBUM 1476]MBZ3915824.1 DUF4349 domain-containing protein [Streptomyces acidiscabies]MDX2960230.1 DUF4349 domain-containing protein [Streptomyces acidiscabies]MDX3019581.1 DUF4349 domain-containing protein [Streptomyces acidiscabies]MDX3793318.1 DUF4349 domain-containing protein [Streptomyces acidiscabies]